MDLGLSGKKAIVTGSTRGIGRAIANLLADEGQISPSVPATRKKWMPALPN